MDPCSGAEGYLPGVWTLEGQQGLQTAFQGSRKLARWPPCTALGHTWGGGREYLRTPHSSFSYSATTHSLAYSPAACYCLS